MNINCTNPFQFGNSRYHSAKYQRFFGRISFGTNIKIIFVDTKPDNNPYTGNLSLPLLHKEKGNQPAILAK